MVAIWLLGPICVGGLAFAAFQRLRMAQWRIAVVYGAGAALLLAAMAWVTLHPEPIYF